MARLTQNMGRKVPQRVWLTSKELEPPLSSNSETKKKQACLRELGFWVGAGGQDREYEDCLWGKKRGGLVGQVEGGGRRR